MRIAHHPIFAHPLPDGHRFPMAKYELLPMQLLHEGVANASHFFEPQICPIDIVTLAHSQEYVNKLLQQTLSDKEQRRIGFPQSPALTQRELMITQGTIDVALYALRHGVGFNIAGGTHHAFTDRGEGFCLLNDFAVAAHYMLQQKLVNKILIVDLDVHQGNGTAQIFKNHPQVFTFSIHGKNNYPFVKEESTLDIPVPDGIQDDDYLQLVKDNLQHILKTFTPDIIFYLSGVDILETDKFGKLKVTMNGCKERDELVFKMAHQQGIGCAVAMGGGYSPQVKTIVEAHCNTYKMGAKIYG